MAYPQERRTQVFTGPRFDNRVYRKGKIQGYSQNQNLDPRRSGADAAAMLEDQAGIKADSQGNWGSVRDYQRDLLLGSQQRNSLSPGVKAGYGSTLRTPLNSNLTPRNFSEGIRQRNQTLTPGAPVMSREQRIAQSQQEGTFDTIRDKYNAENAGSGLRMNRFGNIRQVAPQTEGMKAASLPDYLKRPNQALDPDTPGGASAAARAKMMQPRSALGALTKGLDYSLTAGKTGSAPAGTLATPTSVSAAMTAAPSQQDMNRAALEDRASGLRLLREMSQTPLQVDKQTERIGGNTYGSTDIQGKYGSGFSYTAPAGTKRPEGYEGNIGGRPFSEVMQGLANKQAREGTWREGDRLPEGMTEEQALAESEKNRQNRQSLQRLNKR
jgi:hypothetical protein